MRFLILSDLHSNLEALQAVERAAKGAYDRVICCGDIVGYGPDPDAVTDWVREHVAMVVRGNHDQACSGGMDPEDFSEGARASALWTRDHLRPENRQYLMNLPPGPRDVEGQFAILHGSPRDEDEYIPSPWAAVGVFELLAHRVSFFGHTHLQGGFLMSRRRISEVPLKSCLPGARSGRKARGVLEIEPGETYYLNPGSVGQPRDRDPRAAFAIYDTDGWVEYGRASYDIEITGKKILLAGLPEFLAYRLTLGR
jgi:predicted phosphodiesterase